MYADLRGRGPNYRKSYERRNRQRLERFLADPDGEYSAGYTSSKSFGWELLLYCANWVDGDPRAGRKAAQKAHGFFVRFAEDARRVPKSRALAHCQRCQALAIMAAADRALGRAKKAEQQLRRLLAEVECSACRADFHRRLAIVLRYQGRFSEALAEMACAMELYQQLGHPGHDLDRNGHAACVFGRATIHYRRGDETAGAQDGATALGVIDPEVSPELHRATLSIVAATLLKIVKRSAALGIACPWELLESLDSRLAEALEGLKPSVEWGKLTWLRGMIAGLRGDLSLAEELLFQSQQILVEKSEPRAVGVVTSDIVTVCCLRARVERAETALLRLSYGQRGRTWYRWLPPTFREQLDGAIETACAGDAGKLAAVARQLRDAVAVTEMPELIVAA